MGAEEVASACVAPSPPVLSSGSETLTLEAVYGVEEVGELTGLLQEAVRREREIDSELEQMLVHREALAARVVGLAEPAKVLDTVVVETTQVHESVTNTSTLADKLSSKVRELDLAQRRVSASITRVRAIIDRSHCVQGARSCLDAGRLEEAAAFVATYRALDEEYGEVGEEDGPQSGEQRAAMASARAQLEALVRDKFALAADGGEEEVALRYVRLFPPLGLKEEGIKLYVQYLRSGVTRRAGDELAAVVDALTARGAVERGAGAEHTFVGALGLLFGDVAEAIDLRAGERSLVDAFGPALMSTCVKEMTSEVDARGTQLLRRFVEARQLPRLIKEVTNAKQRPLAAGGGIGGGGGGGDANDARRVEGVLEELTLLCRQSEEFSTYVLERLRDANGGPLNPSSINAMRTSPFNRSIQELIGYSITLEDFYMMENVKKAISIDGQEKDNLISSMVDDSFFLLQKSANRALNTASVQCTCATFNHVGNILANEFRRALEKKLASAPARILAAKQNREESQNFPDSGTSTPAEGAYEPCGALNNAEVSAEYIGKLRRNLEESAAQLFPASSDRERIKSCLSDLGDTSGAFQTMAVEGLQKLSNGILLLVRPSLEAVSLAKYEMNEAEYAANEMDDPWVHFLLAQVEENVAWLQGLLTTTNYENLLQILVDTVASHVENAVVTNKRFNQLGGLQLDKDVRALVSGFGQLSSKSLRDRFARLTQVATIVNLESVGEILDYWGDNSGSMTWRLTPGEVRKVLALRTDFQPNEIAGLKL